MIGRGWFRYIQSEDGGKDLKRINRRLIQRVLTYARPYWRMIGVMLGIILFTTALELVRPLLFRELIDGVLTESSPNYGSITLLNMIALGLIAIPLINGVLRVVQRRFNARVGEGVIYDLRVSLYDHLQQMSMRFYTNTKAGELISRMNNDVIGAQTAISNTITGIITNLITVIATIAVMAVLDWRLTLVGVLVFPLFMVIATQLGKRLREIARVQLEHNGQMNAMMNETLNISGSMLVKLFGRRADEVSRFDERAERVRDAGIQRAVLGAQFFVLLSLVSVVGTALVYWIGGYLVINGNFTVGTVVAFAGYLTQLYGPLQALTTAPVDFATSVVSFERVFEILDLPLEIDEKPDAKKLDTVQGKLAFEGVTFRYDIDENLLLQTVERRGDTDNIGVLSGKAANRNGSNGTQHRSQARENALNNIHFVIEPGQKVALVGPSGAGKTTMTYLIPRLYDPNEGVVRLDDYDLRDLALETLSRHIGMVTQETFLFHDTIRTNLLYAREDATEEEVIDAAIAANIHDFIMELPDGYDTIVGERGYRLSGGEKQRIAIARVILKNPRLLVLDEATSNLDSQSEALIQEALGRVQEGRTSVVIAHRLSTILASDLILVMDRGEIVERGTHAELIAQDGLYASLYETQFGGVRDLEPEI